MTLFPTVSHVTNIIHQMDKNTQQIDTHTHTQFTFTTTKAIDIFDNMLA